MRSLIPVLFFSYTIAQTTTSSTRPASDTRTCYWPDGSAVSTNQSDLYHYTPCFDGDSQCCARGEVCMTNGLCYGGIEGQVYRGACTDQTYRSANCPTFCQDSFPSSWANIVPCEMNGDGQWQWWCGHWDQTKWCTAGKNASLLTYPRGNISKIVGIEDSKAANTSTQLGQNTTSSSGVDSSCPAIPVTIASRNGMLAGVGVGVGAPLLIALGVLFVMLRKEQKKAEGLKSTLDQQIKYTEEAKGVYSDGAYGPGELATNYVYELGESGRTPELDVKRATLRTPGLAGGSAP